jgi:hypothetical protein
MLFDEQSGRHIIAPRARFLLLRPSLILCKGDSSLRSKRIGAGDCLLISEASTVFGCQRRRKLDLMTEHILATGTMMKENSSKGVDRRGPTCRLANETPEECRDC